MRLIELRSNKSSFKTVRFKPNGVSIIAATKETNDPRKTYNSVGKTLTVALIHFCLGSKANKEFETELGGWTFSLEFQIGDTIYKSTRSVLNQKEIDLNGTTYLLKDFNKFLEGKLFDIPKNSKLLSFRGLISRFIRFGEYSYVDYDTYIKKEQEVTRLINNSYLLGLDTALVLKKAELREKEKNILELKKQLDNPEFVSLFGTENKRDIQIKIVELETKVDSLKTSISNFVIAEDYYQIKKEADKISNDLRVLKNKSTKVSNALSNIEKSLEIQPDITNEIIVKLYEEANIQLGSLIKRHLDELESFNKKLTTNRNLRLQDEKVNFKNQLEELNTQINSLGKQEDEKLQYLNSKGALEDYSNLVQLLSDSEKKLHSLNQYQKLISDYKLATEENKKDFTNENIKTDKYLESIRDLIKINILLFKSFVEQFYSDKSSGITIENNEGKNTLRYNIKAKIQDDAGNAVNEVKIFCYDWTILKGKHNHRVDMLFHDSKITGDMDTRQVKTMLAIASQECSEKGFQYVLSLNQNVIDNLMSEMTDDEHKKLVRDNIILSLSDKSPEHKLLGIQIDLDYDR
jgi:uncharacterized protein YydD (DUF2326 family)